MKRAGVMKRAAIAFGLLAQFAGSPAAHAQSGAEANAWAAWCASDEIGGRVDNSSGNLVCVPGEASSRGYSAEQQAMLNVAGQFGSALGAAIRESFARSAQRQQQLMMQRSWEAEQARRQAAADYEAQKLRNQQLITRMRGAIGASELGRTQIGTETLRLRTTDEMFNTPGNPHGELTQEVAVSAPIDLEDMQAALAAYFEALDDVNDAEAAVVEHESYLADLRTFRAEVEEQRDRQRLQLSLMRANDPARTSGQAKLAEMEEAAHEIAEGEAAAIERLAGLRADLEEARAQLREAEGKRAPYAASTAPR